MVIAAALLERITGRNLSTKAHVGIFVVAFFLCSCLLAWIDEHDKVESQTGEISKLSANLSGQYAVFQQEITKCRQDVAFRDGTNQTLQNQNRDQQTTINGCLTQAMKLLIPEPRKLTVLWLDEETKDSFKETRYVLLTTRPVTPVQMAVVCNGRIEHRWGGVLGV